METRITRINEKTGKLEVLSTGGDLPDIWLTVDGTDKHDLCTKCIPFGKCMGFKGGFEERGERRKEERAAFLEEVFSNLEEDMNEEIKPEVVEEIELEKI